MTEHTPSWRVRRCPLPSVTMRVWLPAIALWLGCWGVSGGGGGAPNGSAERETLDRLQAAGDPRAVVAHVVPHPPGVAGGLIEPGDVLLWIEDQTRTPPRRFVEEDSFEKILEWTRESVGPDGRRGSMTLRFVRYSIDDIVRGEFLASHPDAPGHEEGVSGMYR